MKQYSTQSQMIPGHTLAYPARYTSRDKNKNNYNTVPHFIWSSLAYNYSQYKVEYNKVQRYVG